MTAHGTGLWRGSAEQCSEHLDSVQCACAWREEGSAREPEPRRWRGDLVDRVLDGEPPCEQCYGTGWTGCPCDACLSAERCEECGGTGVATSPAPAKTSAP